MWRNFQVTNVVLRRSAAPTLFTPSPPPRLAISTIRMCDAAVTSSRLGSIAHMMAMIARYAPSNASFASLAMPYAVDAPNGDHDFQDLEESSGWVERTILVASVTEDADAITEMHDAVLGKLVYAVDGPDGEHDLEDWEEHLMGVNRIINQASVLENPEKVAGAHRQHSELAASEFYNAKY